MKFIVSCILVIGLLGWSFGQTVTEQSDTIVSTLQDSTTVQSKKVRDSHRIDKILAFAKSLVGTPYKYSGMTPSGFDCSGFVNYVVNHFGFSIPRPSYLIAEQGETIKLSDVKPGDLLFFKGSNLNSPKVGHVAMVVSRNEDEINIIHSSNGKGVAIENIIKSRYYIPRFIKAKRMSYSY
ncbi:MAG: C40 family peptidase [Crocinitomicaceae bacterium]|nr:C40 family peptidase [Crocinitomicaceae bacterium]